MVNVAIWKAMASIIVSMFRRILLNSLLLFSLIQSILLFYFK